MLHPAAAVGGRIRPRPREGLREELAQHLRAEEADWLQSRQSLLSAFPNQLDYLMPRHGSVVDEETFKRMESAPRTAIGMWLLPPEVFNKPRNHRHMVFDVSAVRAGLLLLEV